MRTLTALIAAVAMTAQSLPAAEVSRESIQKRIEQCCETIMARQNDDGSIRLSTEKEWKDYPVGNTALGVMALEYARPHVSGELRAKVHDAIRKGTAYIAQQAPERRTYSAGLTICALFMDTPEKWQRQIGAYATMLALSQHDTAYEAGEWGYRLTVDAGPQDTKKEKATDWAWGDKSNTQFGLLGLYFAQRAGYQVPKIIWMRSADHYRRSQFDNGGWGYKPELRPDAYMNMTIASTISLNLCEEMLRSQDHRQCIAPPRSKEIDNGLKWIAENWSKKNGVGTDTYGLYALERLGIIMGRANIGGHDWYNEGAEKLLATSKWTAMFPRDEVETAFGLMFLARGLEPIVINKLERRDTNDWNNDPYDVSHLTEFIADKYQLPVQWRIVTLEAPLELLLRTPMLYISGHKELSFNDAEKEKLKAYVAGGGTIVGQACCSKKEFDTSFRALVKELFGSELRQVPATHTIYERMRLAAGVARPEVEMASLGEGQGRPVVIYLPHDNCCLWQVGGPGAKSAFAVGSGIYFYVTIELKKLYQDMKEEKGRTVEKAAAKADPATGGRFGEDK